MKDCCPLISPPLPDPALGSSHPFSKQLEPNTKVFVLHSWGQGPGWAGMQVQRVTDHMGRMGAGGWGGRSLQSSTLGGAAEDMSRAAAAGLS